MVTSIFTNAFLAAKNATELAQILGFAKYSELAYLIYPSSKYSTFIIKKKNGTDREINSPAKKLNDVQDKLLTIFNELDNSRVSSHGFRKDRSVLTNAKCHSGKNINFIFNIDLKDFFPSITFARVRGIFLSPPFNLDPRVATVVARLCTYKGVLPQGAPTSPAISNFICRGLDGSLMQLARNNLATYTRYADDITFSFTKKKRIQLPHDIVDVTLQNAVVGKGLQAAIDKHDFIINTSKVRLRSRHVRMDVTGLTVNEFPNVQRRYVDEIRGMLHAWEKYGLAKAQTVFEAKPYKRQLRSGVIPPFENVLRGKLLYLKMVKSEQNKVYSLLARKFNKYLADTVGCKIKSLPVSNLVFDEEDLNKAVFIVSCDYNNADYYSLGTCFFLDGVGLVTCDHAVKFPENPSISETELEFAFPKTYGNEFFGFPHGTIMLKDYLMQDICELEVVWSDETADTAVLKPKGNLDLDYLKIIGVNDEIQSKEIALVGFPNHNAGKSLSIANGKIRSRYSYRSVPHYDISELIRKGNSGGPVLDTSYKVIGVATEGELQHSGNNGVVRIEEVYKLHEFFSNFHGPKCLNKPLSRSL